MSSIRKADLHDAALHREAELNAQCAIILTTEFNPAINIIEQLEIITTECVMGMSIFKDIGSASRDVVGGRNQAFQAQLRYARKTVLDEIRAEAFALRADAIIAVELDYSKISGGGKSMLFWSPLPLR